VPGANGKPQAPHIAVSIFMRGLLIRLITRIYFPDEPLNANDLVLNLLERERRGTLIAQKIPGQEGVLRWDVHLQGPQETVFFEI
jgi:protocatechuate 3,4-dioxygenase alpha subunit